MRGSIQVLQSEMQADPSQAELMDIVLRESDRLNRIITDFLTYARPRKVSVAETDLRDPLLETFALMRHSPEVLDGHTLEEHLPEEPVLTYVDAEGIRQVFWNLSRNALKAMPEGGILRLSTSTSGENVAVELFDSGAGMDEEEASRLFTPYYTTKQHGTGLGLAIVQSVISDHGARISVSSRPGEGTTFRMEFQPRPAKHSTDAALGKA